MIVATTLAATIAFALGLRITGMVHVTTAAAATARAALVTLSNDTLDDDARERAARDASLRLFKASGAIVLRAAMCVALSIVPLWLADAADVARWADVNAFFVSAPGLVTSFLAGSAVMLPFRRS